MRKLNEIIVHTSATRPNWYEGKTAQEKVNEIRRWHVQDNGWSDIGYHYVIDRDGTVVTGRPIERVGAHVSGRNTNSVGICLIGGHGGSEFDSFTDHYTKNQEVALRKLIADLKAKHSIKTVSGHNQHAAKACPCFNVPNWYKKEANRNSVFQSTTVQAGGLAGGGILTAGAAAIPNLNDTAQNIVVVALIIAGLAVIYMGRERIKSWVAGRI